MQHPTGSLLSRLVNRVLGPAPQEPPPVQALPDRRFGDVLTDFWTSHWSKKNSETRRQYDTCLRLYIRPEFDDVRVSTITRDQVRSWHSENDACRVVTWSEGQQVCARCKRQLALDVDHDRRMYVGSPRDVAQALLAVQAGQTGVLPRRLYPIVSGLQALLEEEVDRAK